MARIAIVGPGVIGLTVGAALMEGPHSVVFCGRYIFDAADRRLRAALVHVASAHGS